MDYPSYLSTKEKTGNTTIRYKMPQADRKTIQKRRNKEDNKELSQILTFEKHNIELRRKHKVLTAHSQLHVAKIGDIYRWETTLAPAYLNNAQDSNIELLILALAWIRIQNITQSKIMENRHMRNTRD